jgi:predicted double-glycine peptidase
MRLLLATVLAGCSLPAASQVSHPLADIGGGTVRLPITSLKQMRLAGTLLQQYDFSCGSAALATLLSHHYGHPVTEQEVLQAMYARGDQQKIQREGFSLLDMKRYLEGLGFLADGFEQPLDKLLEARIPALVLINEAGYQHFVVVKGLAGQRVLVGDPARGARVFERAHFESIWVARLLFVIHNRMEQARFNLAADWRAVPRAPLNNAGQQGLAGQGLPKLGPGDF